MLQVIAEILLNNSNTRWDLPNATSVPLCPAETRGGGRGSGSIASWDLLPRPALFFSTKGTFPGPPPLQLISFAEVQDKDKVPTSWSAVPCSHLTTRTSIGIRTVVLRLKSFFLQCSWDLSLQKMFTTMLVLLLKTRYKKVIVLCIFSKITLE